MNEAREHDGLDRQQRAMGLAGQIAAELDEPYAGDVQQVAMGSAAQNLLVRACAAGSYVSGVTPTVPAGSYVSGVSPTGPAGSYVSTDAPPTVVGSDVDAEAR